MGLGAAGFATRGRTRAVCLLLAVLALAMLVEATSFRRAAEVNALIESGAPIPDAAGEAPELRFAQAHALATAQAPAASAARDAALNRYRALQADPRLGPAARYNSANLLVRQAIDVRASAEPGQAIALLELAKEYYRDVLRDDPGQWDARYNLERAQRLLPDADEEEVPPNAPPENAERAATTMRGYTPGLP